MRSFNKLHVFNCALITLACLIPTISRAYDEFDPNPRRPAIVQEQSSGRPPLQKYELIVKNRTSSPITQVYAKSIRMQNYSVDLIPEYSIQPGRQGLVNLYDAGGSCEWAVRAVLADGSHWDITLNVCNADDWTLTD